MASRLMYQIGTVGRYESTTQYNTRQSPTSTINALWYSKLSHTMYVEADWDN